MIPRDPLDPIGGSAWDYDPDAEGEPPARWWGCLAYLAIAAVVIAYIAWIEVKR